jgi:hydrophobe/amphiphile efflux-3 (HAE3) family protein
MMRDFLTRIAAWCVERPAPVMAIAVLVTLVAAVGALSLEADRDPDSLVDSGSEAFTATEDFYERFGDEPVRILIEGDLQKLVLTENLGTILALESCLAGSADGGRVFGPNQPAPAVCERLADEQPAFNLYGPATFLNQTAVAAEDALTDQSSAAQERATAAARAAAIAARKAGLSKAQQAAEANAAFQQVMTQFQQQLLEAATEYGLSGVPNISDPNYVSTVVFDSRIGGGTPKARFSFLFPSPDSAMITVRLDPGLDAAGRERAIGLFRDAVADPAFALRDGSYVVSGVPVIFDGLAQKLSSEIFVLLAVALAIMAITLALVFGPPLRLLPLALALGAAGVTFGLMALLGGSLTMASIAVLPVLTGLAVDYAIQFQARFAEALAEGSSPPRAAVEAAARGGPVIATALLATGAGFAVLLLSPIPMIRSFGLLLVAGVAIAFVFALTAGLAVLSMTKRGGAGGPGASGVTPPTSSGITPPTSSGVPPTRSSASRPVWSGLGAGRLGSLGRSTRGFAASASERLAGLRSTLSEWGRNALAASIAMPGRVLGAALVLAVAGWIAGTKTELISDIRQLLPGDLPELQDVDELERVTGQSGDVYVTVNAPDLTDPALVAWMASFQDRILSRHGYTSELTSCSGEGVELCPGTTLSTLFGGQEAPSRRQIEQILDILPEYFSQAVIDRDEGSNAGIALIAFGIRVMPLDQQKELIDDIRAQLDPPGTESDAPPGVEAEVVGLPVLAADANGALESNRYLLTAAALLVVALVLLAVYRSLARALVPLVPIVLATGWSALVLEAADVPLNPMSATLGALVIAIATEFSVILAARYHSERDEGCSVGEALRRTYARTGSAVAASGATAIAGFAVLVVSDVRMLRDFGLVTVFDLAVALAGVMLVLPAALVWAETGVEPALARLRSLRRPAQSRA